MAHARGMVPHQILLRQSTVQSRQLQDASDDLPGILGLEQVHYLKCRGRFHAEVLAGGEERRDVFHLHERLQACKTGENASSHTKRARQLMQGTRTIFILLTFFTMPGESALAKAHSTVPSRSALHSDSGPGENVTPV